MQSRLLVRLISPWPPEVAVHEVLITRQPVFDRHLDTVAYELRYGQPVSTLQSGASSNAQRFLDTVLELGLDPLVGARLAIVSFPPPVMVSSLPDLLPLLPADRLVLAAGPDDLREPELRGVIRRLLASGCRLLLDLVDDPLFTALPLDDADFIRLSLRHARAQLDRRGALERWLTEQLAGVASYRSGGLRVLVSDVQDYREFVRSRDLGVDLFQGDFLFRPVLVRGRRQAVSSTALSLLARLSDPAIEFEEVERLLAQDVQLTYKLLKLVNAVWFARRTRVESLRQALLVLGLRSVAAWVAVLVLAGIERKPVELDRTALVRARMCELVAGALGVSSRETAFLTGLLSVLDAALDVPLADTLAELPLTSEVMEALLYHRGPLGRVLAAVLSYEAGQWSPLADLPITPMLLTDAFIDALAFAAQALVGLDLAP